MNATFLLSALVAAPLPTPAIDVNRAVAIAERRAPGFVFEAELNHNAEGVRWDVKLLHGRGSWTEVEVCGTEGKVLEVSRLRSTEDLRILRPSQTPVDARRAVRLGLAYRNGTVIAVEQDRDEDRLTWDVYIQTPTGKTQELEFDARHGAFLGLEDASD